MKIEQGVVDFNEFLIELYGKPLRYKIHFSYERFFYHYLDRS